SPAGRHPRNGHVRITRVFQHDAQRTADTHNHISKIHIVGHHRQLGEWSHPVPARVTAVGELFASLVTVRVPEEPPEEDGAKRICRVTLWPAAMEERGIPLVMENAEPETLVWETMTAAVPPFFKVTLWVAVAPTETFPKLRL